MRNKIALFLGLLMLFLTGVFQHISDSEFWPISLAQLFGQFKIRHPSLFYKFIFHALLKIPYFFELNSVEHLVVVRMVFSFIGVMSLILFFKIAKKLFQSAKVASILTALLLSCLFYFSQWSRIRSDFIVLFFCLMGIYLSLSYPSKKTRLAVLSILPLAMILVTPKAIYWIFILSVFCWPGFLYLSLPLIGICSIFVLSSTIFSSTLFTRAYSSAIFYFMNSWSSMTQNYTASAFELLIFLKIHFVQLALSTAGIWVYFLKNKNIKNKIVLSFFVSLICVILHPQKFPFFLGALLPFLILPIGFFILRFQNINFYKLWTTIIIFILAQTVWLTSMSKWWHFNGPQLEKVSEIEGLMKKLPDSSYFDGLGILPRQKLVFGYLGPDDFAGVQMATESVQREKPSFIFRNSRSYLMEPNLSILLDQIYVEIRRGVFVRRDLEDKFPINLSGDLSGQNLGNYFSFEPMY